MLLQLLTVSQGEKINLPAALHYLDRGRLTFPQPSIIPFLRALEDRMLEILNETNYKRYGKRLFEVGQKPPLPQYILITRSYSHCSMQITKTTVLEDQSLQQTFQEAVDQIVSSPVDRETAKRVHAVILAKVFIARCNEYLRAINDEATRKDKKTVDVHIGLRDKLKTYAAEKQIPE